MEGDVRDRMVAGAMAMLATRGLQATSFSEILSATGAPRGSLYHHFPAGKDQLVAAAIDRAGGVLADAMALPDDTPATAVVACFLAIWRSLLTASHCEAGCAVLAVTVATRSPDLLMHAGAVFRGWRELLADLLVRGGLRPEPASRFAVVLIASVEGAVALSRADQDPEPFEIVARQLTEHIRTLMNG